jgi:hypothetical protein
MRGLAVRFLGSNRGETAQIHASPLLRDVLALDGRCHPTALLRLCVDVRGLAARHVESQINGCDFRFSNIFDDLLIEGRRSRRAIIRSWLCAALDEYK